MEASPYNAVQLATMRALRDNGKSMWHLAGHWYFGRPDKAFRKLKVQSIGETPMALLTAIVPLSHAEPGKDRTHAQDKAAVLCSYILWEALFPGERGPKGMIEAMRPMLDLADQPEALMDAIDIFTRMPDGVGRTIMFSFMCSDPVRMAGEQGSIEYFEGLLAESEAEGPVP